MNHCGRPECEGCGGSPASEAWEGEYAKIEAKFLSDIKNGREDGLYVLDTSLFKCLISRLLAAETLKAAFKGHDRGFAAGAKAERSRLLEAVAKLRVYARDDGPVASIEGNIQRHLLIQHVESTNGVLDAVLKILSGEGITN